MKALTLWQPWASLIAHGIKLIETRSWFPHRSQIGQRIAIHAGMKKPIPSEFVSDSLVSIYLASRMGKEWADEIPFGAVVATAVLADVMQVTWIDEAFDPPIAHGVYPSVPRTAPVDPWGDFSVGRYLWFLEDVEPLDPPCYVKGKQGLWLWDQS